MSTARKKLELYGYEAKADFREVAFASVGKLGGPANEDEAKIQWQGFCTRGLTPSKQLKLPSDSLATVLARQAYEWKTEP